MFSRYVLAVIFITTQHGHEFRCDSLLYDFDHGYTHTHTHTHIYIYIYEYIYIYIYISISLSLSVYITTPLLEKTHQMWDPEVCVCVCILAGAFSQLAR